jgi:hypothetical protein
MAEFSDQALGLAPGTTLTIQPRTKAGHNAHKILDQIFFAVLSLRFWASTVYT